MQNRKIETKISIVIPVYNGEKYISKLIDSLKAQTLDGLEFIFVDDLGQDRSMDYVSEWAAEDPRVVILQNQHNLGEGGSRNRGMEKARGLYINTVDPDDWVAPNYYELLYNKAVETSADIVKGTRVKISEDTGKEIKPRSNLNKRISSSLKKGEPLYLRCHFEHQTLLFKHSLLDEKTKYGKSGNAADTTFLLELCDRPVSFAVEEMANYYYLQRSTSATGEFSMKRSRNELVSFEEQIDHFIEKGILDQHSYQYLADRYNSYISRFIHADEEGKVSAQDKEKFIADLKALLLKLPDYEKLYEFDPRIMVVIKQGIVPVNGLNTDISIAKTQAKDWVTYVTSLDGDRKKAAREKLESMLVYYLKARKKEGASLKVMRKELFQIASELEGAKEKSLFYGIIKDAFFKYFPTHRKTLMKLLLGSEK